MDLMDYFDVNKPLPVIHVRPAQVGGAMRREKTQEDIYDEYISDDDSAEIAAESYPYIFKERDEIDCLEHTTDYELNKNFMSEIDESSSIGFTINNLSLMHDAFADIYKKYNFSHFPNEELPIKSIQQKIVSSVLCNPVLVVQGSTGCGKSTQLPQYILDDCKMRNAKCRIAVTQPRRIAAISIASRVATQRKWKLGTVVGYHVGLDNATSDDTLLTFMTTGVLLQKLVRAKHMNEYTHIILDEVHERDKDMDFLMIVVRKFLRTNSKNVKVILMSATFNVHRFADYYMTPCSSRELSPAAILSVEEPSMHNVQEFYLDDLTKLGDIPYVRYEEPTIQFNMYMVAVKLIMAFDLLDQAFDKPGAVLIFLPGISEIEELDSILKTKDRMITKYQLKIIPLHSTITLDEQKRVFEISDTCRKIILSTNIAESSITVPDVQYVIDFCLTKQLVFDSESSISSLQLTWAAHTNCIQRAGRAGRVTDGRVYRLVTKNFYNENMQQESKPEMLRCSLEQLILLTKKLNLGTSTPPHEILALALDPPDMSNIKKTILTLKEVGALLKTYNGKISNYDGNLTFFGHVMAVMPVDIRVTKLILLGHLYSVLDECIIMGAGISIKNVFSTPFKEGMNAYNSKLSWADGSCSDLIALLNVYKVWEYNVAEKMFSRDNSMEMWARRHFLQYRVLRELKQLVLEIKARLKSFQIEPITGTRAVKWSLLEKPSILKIVICGAFYPNYFVRVQNQTDEEDAVRTLAGRSPYNTVYLQGMDYHQPGELYVKSVKRELAACASNMVVAFDGCSNKVYVQFSKDVMQPFIKEGNNVFNSTIPGNNIALEVYRAVRLNQLYRGITFPVLSVTEAKKKVEILNKDVKPVEKKCMLGVPDLPGVDSTAFELVITHMVDPGHFWAQNKVNNDTLQQIFTELKKPNKLLPAVQLQVGMLYAAPYEGEFYRVRVEAIRPARDGSNNVQVFYIDYGNTEVLDERQIRLLPPAIETLPGQGLECVLSEIQPSILRHSQALWSDSSYNCFMSETKDAELVGKIYSISAGVISLELFKIIHFWVKKNEKSSKQISINQMLLDKGFAQPAEENYLSKCNHEVRRLSQNLSQAEIDIYNSQQHEWVEEYTKIHTYEDLESPTLQETNGRTVHLKGPFSPLEMKIYNQFVSNVAASSITIDGDSINTVMIDSDPQDRHERLLVAATVMMNQSRDKLKLRHTTLMPNLHGFNAIMSMLFCPTMELRASEDGTRFTSALCGLGYKENEGGKIRPLFPEHDLLVNIDVKIDQDDVSVINSVRYWMNIGVSQDDHVIDPYVDPVDIQTCQVKIHAYLKTLMDKEREYLGVEHIRHENVWGMVNKSTELIPDEHTLKDKAVYCLHTCIDLNMENTMYTARRHIKKLLSICKREVDFPAPEVTCEICDITVTNINSLRVHFASRVHKSNCEAIVGLDLIEDD